MLTENIGTRVELVPMDSHFDNITIGLYRQQGTAGPEYMVHTYSQKAGSAERVEFVRHAMATLGGMLRVGAMLRHRCGATHHAATRRLFLEACKLASGSGCDPRPLTVHDKKSGKCILVSGAGAAYHVDAEGDTSRAESVAAGLRKLAELSEHLAFECGQAHDELIGLLLPRALNVRAILREEESVASRGVLVAPSAQK